MSSCFRLSFACLTLINLVVVTHGQTNYDESKIPDFTLPDPLTFADGSQVKTADDWTNKRRPQILALFESEVYGKSPARPKNMTFKVTSTEQTALSGKATRKQITLFFTGEADGPQMDILLYIPNHLRRPAPAFLAYNFKGNQSINTDSGIKLAQGWFRDKKQPTESSRGAAKSRWPVDTILDRGYALATIYYGDVDPDFDDGFKNGVHPHFDQNNARKRASDQWGSIAAWAWALGCALDYLETDEQIDAERVAVLGHSRLGKTALWAGATDPRFALVISNNSGCGGAALSRRAIGETVKRINTTFPHWFCGNYKKYNDKEDSCPVDQHMLIALIAPRPVYVASAEQDRWADPKGEFLSAKHASPVYELLGTEGLPAERFPAVDQPAMGTIAYHVRTGKHDVTDFDWNAYLKFADKHLQK